VVAKSKQKQLDDAVAAVAEATRDLTEGAATRITVDFQASGEAPYRIDTPDEQVPLVGLAVVESPPSDTTDDHTERSGTPREGL